MSGYIGIALKRDVVHINQLSHPIVVLLPPRRDPQFHSAIVIIPKDSGLWNWVYPLVNYITMENHHFSWKNSLWMVIFHSYVKLPEGNPICGMIRWLVSAPLYGWKFGTAGSKPSVLGASIILSQCHIHAKHSVQGKRPQNTSTYL